MLNKVDFNVIKQIQDKADIVAVISTFIKLNRKGNNYLGICPFHADRNPSLVVSPKKRIFKCFVCGAKGNVFGFVQQYKKVPFIEAVKIVAQLINFDVSKLEFSSTNTYLDPVVRRGIEANKQVNEWYKGFLYNPENKHYLEYLKKRGLDEKDIKYFEFGYAPKDRDLIYRMASNADQMFGTNRDKELIWNEKELLDAGLIVISQDGKVFDFLSDRITIPIYDNNGYLVAFSGRTIQDVEPKYLNTSTTKLFSKANTLFNFAKAKQVTTNKLIIVEGYMDAIAYYRAGFPNVVATMGVALSNEHLNALSTLTNLETVILSFDNDNAGQIATINHGRKLMENGFNTYVVGGYDKTIKDVDELLNKHGKMAIDKILDERVDYVTFMINSHFVKSLPLDEIQKVTNEIISMMIDLGDNSLLLRSKHLKLLAEKSGLDYQDLLTKYEHDIQKINTTSSNEKVFTNKPYKPTNNIGLDKTFMENDEPKIENSQQHSLMSSLYEDMTSQKSLVLRSLTDAYDYLIEMIINNPTLLQRVSHDLTFNTTFEFEQQDIIFKSIRYLQEKQTDINDKVVLDLLKTKGEKNSKYLKAHDYLSKQLSHSYYINYSKNIFNKNAEHRLDVTTRNIINLKKELLLYNKIIKMIELAKDNPSENNPEIDKILLDIKMIKKIKN